MPIGEHFFTCRGCGIRDICGDCIPEYCRGCEEKRRKFHPGDGCPCSDCEHITSDRRIREKLAAEGIEDPRRKEAIS